MSNEPVLRPRHVRDGGGAMSEELMAARRTPDGVLEHLRGTDYLPGQSIPASELYPNGPTSINMHLQEVIGAQHNHLVFQAHHDELGDVALKMVWPKDEYTQKDQSGLANEIKALKRLDHPNLQRLVSSGFLEFDFTAVVEDVYTRDIARPRTYIATEYVPGLPLSEALTLKGTIPLDDLTPVVEQVCSGIAHAHDNGVIHGDIKPANIVQKNEDHYVVIDFETALVNDNAKFSLIESARCGLTLHYAAPEVFDGTVTDRSDQYSIGVTLYYLLTNHFPHQGNTPEQTIGMKKANPPTNIINHREGLSESTAAAIMRSLEHSPEDRYSSVAEMRDAILDTLVNQEQ